MRAAKARRRLERPPPLHAPVVELPALRRIVAVIDFAGVRPQLRMMQMWRSRRRDCYWIKTPRGESSTPVGWSRALAAVRKAMPRSRA